MANNRMYLTHRPSGLSVYLGKRMGWEWYNTPDDLADQVRRLFECAPLEDGHDDFCISLEAPGDSTLTHCDWEKVDADAATGLLILVKERQDAG